MKPGLLFLLTTLWIFSASATAYFVSPTGDDLNKGNKWFTPFKTIQKSALVARAGDTVYIMKGDYNSDDESVLHINRSGNENAWIVFKNYLNHKPVLHVKNKFGIWIQSASYISIEGLSIVSNTIELNPNNTVGTGIFIDGTYTSPCTHLKIFNNFIQQLSGSGIYAQNFDYLTLSYNKFFSNSLLSENEAAIYLKNAIDIDGQKAYHNFIQGNVFEKNGMNKSTDPKSCGSAIHLDYNPKYLNSKESKTLIHNNIIYKSGGGGLQINGALGLDIVNNTFYKNSEREICRKPEIEIINSSGFNVLNNIFYSSPAKPGNAIINSGDIHFQNNLYYNFSSMDHGVDDLIANPEFEMTDDKNSTFNFRLKGNSPAINAGVDKFLSDIDFEGNTRKMDTHVDLGALEFINRVLPSLKNIKAGIQSKGIQSFWSSLYTKDQKMYTIWNQQNLGFSIRLFDGQGNLILEKIRSDTDQASFEIDFNVFPVGFYTVISYNSNSKHIERILVETRAKTQ